MTFVPERRNGKNQSAFPCARRGDGDETIRKQTMAGIGSYLKKHTEALVKDVGIEPACALTGKSKATLVTTRSAAEHAV